MTADAGGGLPGVHHDPALRRWGPDPGEGPVHHVVPHAEGWAVRSEGHPNVSHVFGTKAPAVKMGRRLARRNEGHLVIHRQDGTIQEHHHYGDRRGPAPDRSSLDLNVADPSRKHT